MTLRQIARLGVFLVAGHVTGHATAAGAAAVGCDVPSEGLRDSLAGEIGFGDPFLKSDGNAATERMSAQPPAAWMLAAAPADRLACPFGPAPWPGAVRPGADEALRIAF